MTNTNEMIGNVFQALADPTRRAVIRRLGTGPASTKELAKPFDMALPSFMQHLNVLENSGLIASEKVGRVRTWKIELKQLDAAEAWLSEQRAIWEDRADRFADYVEMLQQRGIEVTSSYEFTVTRHINASRSLVWQAWTTPEHLEKWWVPRPMTARVVGFDLRPGGAFDLQMFTPDGQESSVTGAFLDIVPESLIVFTTALTSDWRPAETPVPITAFISMTEDDNTTRYNTRVLYKNKADSDKLHAMNFEAGWSIGIDQLEELVIAMA